MLKWIKKFKNWIQGEEIIEIEEVIIDDSIEYEEVQKLKHNNQNVPSSHRRSAQLSDPDTKVLYQYPKGQFKFPLIPDERSLPKRKPSERVREEIRPKIVERRNHGPAVVKTEVVASEPKRKIGSPKKPFRPTEIPSAVYGFQRPQKPKTEKTVEFELETNPNLPQEHEPTLDVPAFIRINNQPEEQPIQESIQKPASEAKIIPTEEQKETLVQFISTEEQEEAIVESTSTEEQEEAVAQSISTEEQEEAVVESISTEEQEKAVVESISTEEQEEAVVQSTSTEEQEKAVAQSTSTDEQEEAIVESTSTEEQEEAVAESTSTEEQEEAVAQSTSTDEQEEAVAQSTSTDEQEEAVVESTSTDEQEEAISESISTVGRVEVEQVRHSDIVVEEKTESIQPVMAEEKEAAIQTIKNLEEKVEIDLSFTSRASDEPANENEEKRVGNNKEEQPRKKHIPFNVVMLKQDQKKQNFPSFKEGEKKTEHFHSAPNLENITKVPTDKEKVDYQEAERALQTVVPDEMKQESNVVEARVEENIVEIEDVQMATQVEQENPYYVFPDIELLTPPTTSENDEEWLEEQTALLDETLLNFNVRARVVNVTQGPAVTRFEVQPEPGVKVNKVTNLMDDIKLSLAAQDMRMEAPIPGKHTIGIEIPNRKSKPVFLREVLESEAFQNHSSPLAVAMGLDISGQPIVTDLRKMPHGLIAGQTGSGKSVCINTMLVSLLYKATPQEVKLMLIDPKMVELAPYNRIPHLVSPVITDVKAATAALKWAVEEMERRYELFVHAGVRDITKFNEHAEQAGQYSNKLPYILIIIDELADLMMMSPADVEEAICRIAQKARACGIHLIVATQRPSVDVITGLIKANIPTRVAFSVSSQVDSRTIIDSGGAEKLLGRGDMLFAENGSSKTIRLQGTFVSDDEIDQVVKHVKKEQQPNYLFEQEELLNRAQVSEETDELFFEACEFVVSQHSASTSSVQRRFRVGYNRAARLIEMMEQQGIISESRGSKAREVLITEDDLEYLHETNTAL